MRANALLEEALKVGAETVLDVGVGRGDHAKAFIGQKSRVTGIDPRPANKDLDEHKYYTHIQDPYEKVEIDELFDMVWCSHTLEHIPNVQHFLITLQSWLKPGGWLFVGVPTDRQQRIHVGHLTLWTPAHLAYNLVCAGWDCSEAIWYTDDLTIGMVVQRKEVIDLSWRTSLPGEIAHLNQYLPKKIRHNDGAWWGNNWPVETSERVSDPPLVTLGIEKTNLPPATLLDYGPNPDLRKGYERFTEETRPKDGPF